MMRGMNICGLMIIALLCANTAFGQILDSTKSISIAGQFYGLHKVQQGETLFSISKQYQLTVDDLRTVNRLEEGEGIAINSLLIVPLSLQMPTGIGQVSDDGVKPEDQNASHEVKQGETLYSIARQYPFITTKMIREANDMTSDTVKIGQVLTIPQSIEKKALFQRREVGEALVAERNYTLPVDTAEEETMEFLDIDESGSVVVETLEEDTTEKVNDLYDFSMLAMLKRQYEAMDTLQAPMLRGVATWLQDSGYENQKKFYALHKELPVGTILKVRNLMNSREVYVKVIGKLPNIPENQKVVVKVSAAAAHYLNVLDDKFLVELAGNTP